MRVSDYRMGDSPIELARRVEDAEISGQMYDTEGALSEGDLSAARERAAIAAERLGDFELLREIGRGKKRVYAKRIYDDGTTRPVVLTVNRFVDTHIANQRTQHESPQGGLPANDFDRVDQKRHQD